MARNFSTRSADVSRFAMTVQPGVPRSVFRAEQTHKTAFDSGWLVPIYLDEVLPGDSHSLNLTAFCRMTTPLYPVMDNLHLDTFFFFVPTRLIWKNFHKFMGEQKNPADSTAYLVPTCTSPVGGFAVSSLFDYLGLPTVGQVGAGNTVTVNALPLRAYALIYNEWFRDENLSTPNLLHDDDGPDSPGDYTLIRRGKRHDYFTSCLPWPQKPTSLDTTQGFAFQGGIPVSGLGAGNTATAGIDLSVYETGEGNGALYPKYKQVWDAAVNNQVFLRLDADGIPDLRIPVNSLRNAYAVQTMLEREARGGSRYTEIVKAHFGVTSPDARLQRPEYLGGGSSVINVNPIAQTGPTVAGSTPLGNLSAVVSGVAQGHGFSQSFTEHGYIMGLVNVRADLTYQQGLERLWSRRTKFDFYWPAFAQLGEQAVLRQEIYATGDAANDQAVFGYQERWAEYRYKPNRISGVFRSTAAGTLDAWHFAQKFTVAPTLGATFINEDPPIDRVLAVVGPAADQFFLDSLCSVRMVRPMPAYSTPGLGARF